VALDVKKSVERAAHPGALANRQAHSRVQPQLESSSSVFFSLSCESQPCSKGHFRWEPTRYTQRYKLSNIVSKRTNGSARTRQQRLPLHVDGGMLENFAQFRKCAKSGPCSPLLALVAEQNDVVPCDVSCIREVTDLCSYHQKLRGRRGRNYNGSVTDSPLIACLNWATISWLW